MSKIVKKKDLDVLIESTLKKAGIETIKEFATQPNDDQKLAEKILSVIKNNPEKVRNLIPYPQNDHHSYIAYNFYLGDSPNLIHIRAENPKGISSKVSEYRYVLLMGKPNSYHIKCSSKTAKEIFETISNLDSGSRNNFLRGLGESTLKKVGIDSNVVRKQVTSINGEEPSDEEMDNIRSAIKMGTKTDNKNKKKSTSSDKSLSENNAYFKFKNQDSPWYDLDDQSYDELPEDEYEELEYDNYDTFAKDYPRHIHFQGYKDVEGSRSLFDRHKQNYGPLTARRKKMSESTSSDKSLINEELMRFNNLTNYTYKK